jgi:hypothetical protein
VTLPATPPTVVSFRRAPVTEAPAGTTNFRNETFTSRPSLPITSLSSAPNAASLRALEV